MKSGYKIFWSERAIKDLDKILAYLEQNWSSKEINIFLAKLEKRIQLILLNPELFPKTEKRKSVRKSVLSKHTIIYYKLSKDSVILLTLFDPRQNPAKLKIS